MCIKKSLGHNELIARFSSDFFQKMGAPGDEILFFVFIETW